MKKLLIVPMIIMVGCKSTQPLIQQSDMVILSKDTSNIYFLNKGYGSTIYQFWKTSEYGKNRKLHLMDEDDFMALSIKSTKSQDYLRDKK